MQIQCELSTEDVRKLKAGALTKGHCPYAYALVRDYSAKNVSVDDQEISFRIGSQRYYYRTPVRNSKSIHAFDEWATGQRNTVPRMVPLVLSDDDLVKVKESRVQGASRVIIDPDKPKRIKAKTSRPAQRKGTRNLPVLSQ